MARDSLLWSGKAEPHEVTGKAAPGPFSAARWPGASGWSGLASLDTELSVPYWSDVETGKTQKEANCVSGERNVPRASSQPRCSRRPDETLGPCSRYLNHSCLQPLHVPSAPFAIRGAGDGIEHDRRFAGCERERRSQLWVQYMLLNIQGFFFFSLIFSPNCNSLSHHPSCKCDSYAFSNVTLSLNK